MGTQSADQIPASDATATRESEPLDPTNPKGSLLERSLVISSAVKNPSSLIAGLTELLQGPPDSDAAENSQNNNSNGALPYWTLEPAGNGITRVFAFRTEDEAARFRDQISTISDEMNHHASMRQEGLSGATGDLVHVKVRCTTHRPAGLSMRDVRLARKINELADTMI